MRFVHFVKLVPKFSEVFFRDRIAAVKYAHTDVVFFTHHSNLDPPFFARMMDRVSQIVAEHLLRLKFIRPHTYRFIRNKINRSFRLLNQNLTARQHALDQFYHIKPRNFQFFRAKFQLI